MNFPSYHWERTIALAVLIVTGLVGPLRTASASSIYVPGDLLVSFRATGSDGGNADLTYTFDLGAATIFRDATGSTRFTFELGPDLATAFGANWATRPDIFWGIVGNFTNAPAGSATNGDPVRTIYVSQDQTTLGEQAAPPVIAASGTRGTVTGNIQTFGNAFDTRPAASDPRGSIVSTSAINDYTEFGLDTVLDFGSTFGFNGIEGNSTSGITNTALDLFRMLNSTSGADPLGLVGTGSYEGTFTMDNNGTLTFGVVPEPGSFGLLVTAAAMISGFGRWRARARVA